MGKTIVSASDAIRVEKWRREAFHEAQKESFFNAFESTDGSSIVHTITDLEKDQGDKVTLTMLRRLTGSGVTEGQVMEGAEEKVNTYTATLELKRYRQAVRMSGALTRKRTPFDLEKEIRGVLKVWMMEKMDELKFDAIQSSPTRVFVPNSTFKYTTLASAKTALATGNTLTPSFLTQVGTFMKTGGARTIDPIKPVMIGGKRYYVALFYPDALYDLKNNAVFAQARREADIRGKENPLFTGAVAVWDGIIIHEHENMNYGTNAGAGGNVNYSQGVIMGRQALLWAWGARPEYTEETWDFKEDWALQVAIIAKAQKPVFNSLDYGSVGVMVERTKISDA